jgi:hypothetical protein
VVTESRQHLKHLQSVLLLLLHLLLVTAVFC